MANDPNDTQLDLSTLSYEDAINLHKVNRREKLLRDSAAAFASYGVDKLSMVKVAEYAGVSKIVLYRYFKSKDDLIDSILKQFVDQLLELDARDQPWGQALVYDNLKLIREYRDAYFLMVRHLNHDSKFTHHYQRCRSTLIAHTNKRLEALDAQREPNAIDRQFVSESICSFMMDSINAWLESGDEENDRQFVRWLVKSIATLADTWAKD